MIKIVSCGERYKNKFPMKRSVFIPLIILAFLSLQSYSQIGYSVDVFPTNIGGKSEFKRVFEQELIYPADPLKKNIGGKVNIRFTIMKDSSVTNVKAVTSGNAALDAEALRLFSLYQWVPAIKDGQYVSTNWSVVFDFEPSKYAKICKARGFTKFKYLPKMSIDSTGTLYKYVDQIPMYQKGTFALQDFIKENLEYPRQAQISNIQGTVILRFVVEPSGLVTNIGVQKSVGGGCDQEAERVLQMIKWYPGKKDGKLVRTQMTYPFYFILNEDFKDNSAGEQK